MANACLSADSALRLDPIPSITRCPRPQDCVRVNRAVRPGAAG